MIIFILSFVLIGWLMLYISGASNNVLVKGSFNVAKIDNSIFTEEELRVSYPGTQISGATKGIKEGRATIVDVEGYGRMLRAYIPKDSITVGKTGVSYLYEIPGDDRNEIWIEQDFKLDPGWPWSKGPENGGKFGPSLYIGPSRNSGCRPSDGGAAELASGKPEAGSGGSVRIGWYDKSGGASFYVYHADMGGDPEVKGSQCGKSFRWTRDSSGNVVYATPSNPFPNGTPYNHPVNKITKYVMQVKLNTENKYNGEINVFADGVHVGGVREIRFKLDGIKWGVSQGGQNMFLGGQSKGHEFASDTYYFSSPQTLYENKPTNLTLSNSNVEPPPVITPDSTASKPLEPKNINLSTSANSITINWSQVANAEKYGIRYKLVGTDDYSLIKFTTNTNYTIENLEPEKNYEVGILSGNKAGFSRWVTNTTFVDFEEEKPEGVVPERPVITSLTSTNSTITLTWVPNNNKYKYSVRFKRNQSDSWNKALLSTNISKYTISGLTSGPLFDVQVLASNEIGASRWSEISSIRTK